MTFGFPAAAAIVALCCAAPAGAASGQAQASILKQFQERVAGYLKLRESVEPKSQVLKPTSSPDAIEQHERELAAEIRQARASARPGDLFTPQIAAEFRRLIRQGMRGPAAERVRTSIQHAEPVRLALRVNDSYPSNVPLPSTPPTLLMKLPPLPRELDYRVLGHDLVLRDTGANLIVDYMADAAP